MYLKEVCFFFFFFPCWKRIFETEGLIPTCVNPVQSLGCVFWSSFNFTYKQMTETEHIWSITGLEVGYTTSYTCNVFAHWSTHAYGLVLSVGSNMPYCFTFFPLDSLMILLWPLRALPDIIPGYNWHCHYVSQVLAVHVNSLASKFQIWKMRVFD